ENISRVSSTFLTDILVENINLHLEYKLLLEFLPNVWKEDNRSSNLLAYIAGVLHRMLYLAREQPLGKEISKFHKKEFNFFHQKLCEFRSECLDAVEILEKYQFGKVETLEDLVSTLDSLPKMSTENTEMLRIMSIVFLQFATHKEQTIRNIDELSLFLSRCLILWKLKTLTDSEINECLNSALEKYSAPIELTEFEETLSLEVQTYQFLQYGLNHDALKLITSTFKKIYDSKI
ncbi:MAG: hypothetical protein ACTSQF_10685, partial [Candidatus Heimdallarchaeaceae archaeon]